MQLCHDCHLNIWQQVASFYEDISLVIPTYVMLVSRTMHAFPTCPKPARESGHVGSQSSVGGGTNTPKLHSESTNSITEICA